MASIRERKTRGGKSRYTAQVRMDGFPARTETFPTRRLAERWATTAEAEMIEGRAFRNAEARRRTLADAVDRYLRDDQPSKATKGQLNWWRDQIGKVKLADVTPALVVEHRNKLKSGTYQKGKPEAKGTRIKKGEQPRQFSRSGATVNRYLSALGKLFTTARREWHWAHHNPVMDVSRFQEDERIRWLSEDERRALLKETAKDPVLNTFVLIALSTACRAGELLALRWSDVDTKTGRILWRQPKNRQARSTWLYGEALAALKAHGKVRDIGGRVFPNVGGARRERGKGKAYDYAEPFKAAVAAAGIKDFRFHDCRHSAATWLAQQGASEAEIQAIGGWKSGVVKKYIHLAAMDSRGALKKLADRIEGK